MNKSGPQVREEVSSEKEEKASTTTHDHLDIGVCLYGICLCNVSYNFKILL
jgi:hypothetical protein